MKNFIAGLIAGPALLALLGFILLKMGALPVATDGPPLPLEKWIARTAIHAAIGKEEDKPSPIEPTDDHLVNGAKIYLNNCAGCHGLPHEPEPKMARAMFPKTPFLMPPKRGVTDDPIGEIYWKAKNGIRLTGMPGFSKILTDTELWEVSQVLLHADKLPVAAGQILKKNSKL